MLVIRDSLAPDVRGTVHADGFEVFETGWRARIRVRGVVLVCVPTTTVIVTIKKSIEMAHSKSN